MGDDRGMGFEHCSGDSTIKWRIIRDVGLRPCHKPPLGMVLFASRDVVFCGRWFMKLFYPHGESSLMTLCPFDAHGLMISSRGAAHEFHWPKYVV